MASGGRQGMGRTLRSKKLRSLLWYTADGKCQVCGCELPDDWHADHIIPYSKANKTNVHDMQALCPECNRKKGIMSLRRHQVEMMEVCEQILGGRKIKTIIGDITPGGGKSALPVILAHKLIPNKFDKICWVVPRSSLREQGEGAFTEKFFRLPFVLGHNCLIRQSTNDTNPSRGFHGFITTYQAIAQNPWALAQEFSRHNYILFLDEPHHIATDSPFAQALAPLVSQAGLVVFASGTLERSDKKQIAFLPYHSTSLGLIVDLQQTEEVRIIKYSRRDALEEKAIVPLEFIPSDSKAEWTDKDGETQSIESFYDGDIDARSALRTVLETGFAIELLDKTIHHWQGHKKLVFHDARLLVVSPSIVVAKSYLEHLKSQGIKCAIVHSKEDDKTTKGKIKRFKKGGLDALVTVAIAYEGLDVPEITHIACLTHYRSKPWLEQCFARSNRTIGKKERGFIFAPDDPDINRVIEELRLEQLGAAREIEEREIERELGKEVGSIVPQGSELTASRAVAPDPSNSIDTEQYTRLERAMIDNGFLGHSITQFNKAIIDAGYISLTNSTREVDISAPLVTPSQEEENLRTSIDTYTKKVDKIVFNMRWGSTNKEIFNTFQKSREDMTIEELKGVWRYIQVNYPIEGVKNENPYIG